MSSIRNHPRVQAAILCLALALIAAACGSSSDNNETSADGTAAEVVGADETDPSEPASEDDAATTTEAEPDADNADDIAASTFTVEVWADNWMAVYVDGELIGEDSVPITTERSFNAETFTFEATYPFTIAIEAKDFKETDSGIEYIGQPNQQMGDGGLIAQVTDTSTGEVVAATSADWSVLVVQRAPLNTECADDPDPDATCESESVETPSGWADADFDDTGWDAATEWTAAAVGPKDGYDEIGWDEQRRVDLGLGPRGRQHHPHALLRRG